MPAALDALRKSEIVSRLYAVFSDRGYDGSSLADLSEATGLGRSSLYHHFPRGKEQMAEAVLEQVRTFIQESIANVATSQEPLDARIQKVAEAFNSVFAGGSKPCGLGKLAVAEIGPEGRQLARDIFDLWAVAIAQLARDSGMAATEARQFAEDWIARVQGSLILHSASGDRKPFERALAGLTQLVQPSIAIKRPGSKRKG